jgi:mRNA interferase MazF
MDMKQFDVYSVNLDPTTGSEFRKTRPGVIVSPDVMNKHLKTVIVAPLTSTLKGYPSRVHTRFKGQDGEIALDQVRAVDKTRLVKRLGKIDPQTADAALQVLQTMFQS